MQSLSVQRIVIMGIGSMLLAGCASSPTGNIEAFGSAATEVSTSIDTVISDYNQAVINNHLVAMAQSKRAYVAADFDDIKQIIIRDANKQELSLNQANKALGDYAKALVALARAGSREEIAISTSSLSKALLMMDSQHQLLLQKEAAVTKDGAAKIARVIAQLSSGYIESKKAKALKTIIIAADPAVQKIGLVVNNQLLKGVIESRLYTMRGSELAGYFADYNAKSSSRSFVQKKQKLDEIYEKYVQMEATSASVKQAQTALLAVMKSHQVLKGELEKDNYSGTGVIEALKKIKANHTAFDALETLIKNCDTEIIPSEEQGIICKP